MSEELLDIDLCDIPDDVKLEKSVLPEDVVCVGSKKRACYTTSY